MGLLGCGLVWLVVLSFSSYYLLLPLLEEPPQLEIVDALDGLELHHLADQVGQFGGYFGAKLLLNNLGQCHSTMEVVARQLLGVNTCQSIDQSQSSAVDVVLDSFRVAWGCPAIEEGLEVMRDGEGSAFAVEVLSRLGRGLHRGRGPSTKRLLWM